MSVRRRLATVVLAVAATLSAGAAAQASRGLPVKVRPVGTARAAVPAQPYAGRLEVVTDGSLVLSNFRLDGAGWTTIALEAPASAKPAAGLPLIIAYTAVAADVEAPLFLRFEAGGRPQRHRLAISPAAVQRLRRRAVVPTLAPPHLGMDARAAPRPGPRPAPVPAALEKDRAGPGTGAGEKSVASRDIRVRGRFVYTRSDGVTLGADGVTARVYDEDDPFGDELLGSQTLGPDGAFDVTFHWSPCWSCDDRPDIYVEFEAANDRVVVESAFWETNYTFETPVEEDYEGSDLNFGDLRSSDDSLDPALHILATTVQGRRWLDTSQGYDVPYVEIQWPDGSGASWYISLTGEMHITSTSQWRESTILHEYGHHWTASFGIDQTPDYCNGVCDDDPNAWPIPDCGHCAWCAETDHDAWQEGFANWYAEHLTTALPLQTGQLPVNLRRWESPGNCIDSSGVPCDCDPILTEGWLTNVLHDIEDANQDDATGWPGSDELSMGADEIFAVADHGAIHTPMEFLIVFKNDYPAARAGLWATARDNGYEIDWAAPGAVSGLTSPSHPLFSTSADRTVEMTWTAATDDCSGIGGYACSFSAGAPAAPPAVANLGPETSLVSDQLDPGSWYFNIRAIDRAAIASASWRSYGPFTIRAPEPVDLEFRLPLGWAIMLVPRPDATATVNEVPAPSNLVGDEAATWWNAAGRNAGEVPTSTGFSLQLLVDGEATASASIAILLGGGTFTRVNRGPVAVRGGRHTFEALIDADEVVPEQDETDNSWAEQWIWSPQLLTPGKAVTRAAPPARTAGWQAIGPGPTLWYNCDGLRLNVSGWWNAVWVHAVDDAVDYDCRLHVSSDEPQEFGGGFGANIGWSGRSAGLLDAVIVNRNVTGTGTRDVGVIRGTGAATSQYVAKQITSQAQSFGQSVSTGLAAGEMMLLREIYLGPAALGWVDVLLQAGPGAPPLHVIWLDRGFGTGDLLDAAASATTDGSGRARLSVEAGAVGYYCLGVYRDPRDEGGKAAAVSFTLETLPTPPDFRPVVSPGWYAALVPRAAADAGPTSLPAPVALTGNAAATWLNLGSMNDSPGPAASAVEARVSLAGAWLASFSTGVLGPHQSSRLNNQGPYSIRGGRHTLGMWLDPDDGSREISDQNNLCGEQWIWSPLPLGGSPVTRPSPPPRAAGFGSVTSGEPLYYNCDGLRTPLFAPVGPDGYWGALAVMAGPASNVDLRLHPLSAGAKEGFAASLAGSYWGAGRSDFVIVNFNQTDFAAFDAGIVGTSGSESYTVEVVASKHLGIDPSGPYGPFLLGAGRIMHLYEAWLEPGFVICRLENLSGTIDWGLSVHPGDDPWIGKSETLAGGAAWFAPGGADESVIVHSSAAVYYAIAVWKARALDLAATGSYRLVFHRGLTDAPPDGGAPARTRLASVSPNPFNPQATVSFELARSGRARLEVYDLRGARLATLVDADLVAGRHAAVWDGTDAGGRPVASGVYAVRLEADGVREMRRLTLLK